jgi:hypothetical protein
MRIKPHDLFTVWSPDEVAECLGVDAALYAKIWNEIVPLYADQFRSEVPDDFDRRCLAKFWSNFTDDEKRALNEAAERHESRR